MCANIHNNIVENTYGNFSIKKINFYINIILISMFLELKEIAHCFQWKKKRKKKRYSKERREKRLSLRPGSLRWRFSRFSLCIDSSSLRTIVFSFTNPSFRVFLTKTETFNETNVKFRNESMFHAALSFNGDWHNRPIQIDYPSLKELATSFPSFQSTVVTNSYC